MGFMHGSAFDIMISASLAAYSLELFEVFGTPDYVSTGLMGFFLFILVIFLAIMSRFSFVISNKVNLKW